jgi:hypothetical protein
MYGLKKRSEKNIRFIETDTDDVTVNTGLIVKAAEELRSLR